jgi:diaminohydroxyphosphoribosylaminopyrimidine deaminase/5-amino-6-(5-phosphoribosylamino)uracil reductase
LSPSPDEDRRWLDAAAAVSARGRPLSAPNPAVGCVIVRGGRVVARGWTQPGGRPHAEAMALAALGGDATGATVYVSLEPCAHASPRGPSCADLLVAARPARVVAGSKTPIRARRGWAGAAAHGRDRHRSRPLPACAAALAGFLLRTTAGRPHVTLKLALTLDGAIALANGQSRWITGRRRAPIATPNAPGPMPSWWAAARCAPMLRLDVRLPGLERAARSAGC